MAKKEKVVAIGEIGLDFSADEFNKKRQFEIFEKQLQIAQDLNLPVIIHSRDASNDTMSILKNFKKIKGVIHCFSGDQQLAEKYVAMGWYIGFTGILTFKNAKKAVISATNTPIENILVETDCPYMAPEPLRGTVCNSSMLYYIILKLAELKNIDPQETAYITKNNAIKLYNIKR